ncbi:hypothetical protein scyTo_0007416 [Scyliorhinus torazame]|uniref:Uncharacterized protein n=1 Tax=Scyliorhinus torazame TaxID=75743 RepID=A0A401NS30_SCYTO|nr:hypothetical protein [Scyliorhinus torazame]
MIRIFPDFSVQVTAATGGGGGAVTATPGVGRIAAAAANGTPQNVGLSSYQQRGPSFCYQASVMPRLTVKLEVAYSKCAFFLSLLK